jgi:hypothetical protein
LVILVTGEDESLLLEVGNSTRSIRLLSAEVAGSQLDDAFGGNLLRVQQAMTGTTHQNALINLIQLLAGQLSLDEVVIVRVFLLGIDMIELELPFHRSVASQRLADVTTTKTALSPA